MLARGNSRAVAAPTQTYTQNTHSIHSYLKRQGILNDRMIPLKSYAKNGRRLNTEKGLGGFERRGITLTRLNSAPELHRPELPPILGQGKVGNGCGERRNRPLTPLVSSSRNTRSLPKNYRINLDLVPLLEAGPGVGGLLPLNRRRQTSLSSSDSCPSSTSPSPRLQSRSASPRMSVEARDDSLDSGFPSSSVQKRPNSAESGEDVDSDEDLNVKDTMILRWLQTVENRTKHRASYCPVSKKASLCS